MVEQCGYWWSVDNDEWCDLAESSCDCQGSGTQCPLGNQAISAAMRGEKISLEEAAQRIRRRRSLREAS